MKTFVNKKTGERFPEHGCSHWFWIHETRTGKEKFEIFERGKGWRNGKLKEWIREEIQDYQGPEASPHAPEDQNEQWKAYAEKYGVLCAREFLACCDYMKPTFAFQIITPPANQPSKVARAWFESVFGADPIFLAVPILMGFYNRYSFDVLAFERQLKHRHGYPAEKDGVSMKMFIAEKWGADVCAYFENHFLKAS